MTVIAAVDGDSGSKNVVREGYDLATAFDDDLVVLNVQPETADMSDAEEVADDASRLGLVDRSRVEVVGALGDPAPRILNEADERDARYIVLGPQKRTPVGKALMGSVSQLVMLNTDRAVVFAPR